MQETNGRMGIRVLKLSDSVDMHKTIFSHLAPTRTDLQLPLRELWIRVDYEGSYKLPPLSKFCLLEKLVVRAAGETPISYLLETLDID